MHKNFLKKGSLLKRGKLIATVGTITVKSFDVKGYRTLTAEFESAVPEASRASIAVKRGNTALSLTPEWKDEGKKVELKYSSALPEGEYILSVAGKDTDKKVTVGAEEVKEITILGEKVLTGTSSASKEQGRSNDEAYIYYDVKNQYGESIRHRVTVNWNITSCDTNKERSNRNLGLVVAQRKNDREIFTYGTRISITGTCILGDKNYSQTFEKEIGMQQAVQDVVFRGIVSERSDEDKSVKSAEVKSEIDSDFTKGTHAVLYQVKDQQGNFIESSRNNLGSVTENAKLVLRSKTPKLVQDSFKDGGIFTITDENDTDYDQPKYQEYCSANIEPGRFVDKGGDVTFTYLATGAGGTNDTTYKIGETPRLASFKIDQKAGIVADGDVNVDIPFTAIDTKGNVVKDYKTIARSSNYLNFTASDGKLVLREKDNGEAVLEWSDAERYTKGGSGFNPYDKDNNNGIVINDGIIRAVSLTATVESEEGTESRSTVLSVSDMRRPNLVSDVRYGDDSNDIIISKTSPDKVDIVEDIDYIDQYGEKLLKSRSESFWKAALKDKIAGCQYGLRLKNLDEANIITGVKNSDGTLDYAGTTGTTGTTNIANNAIVGNIISHSADSKGEIKEAKVSYSIIRRDATSSATISGSYNQYQWYELGRTRNETYTMVPLSKVSDFKIGFKANKFGLKTILTEYADGSYNFNNDNSSSNSGTGYNLNEAVSGEAIKVGTNAIVDINTAATSTETNTAKGVNYYPLASEVDAASNDKYGNKQVTVTSKYKTYTLTVPSEYYASTKDGIWSVKADGTKSNPVSGSSVVLDANGKMVGILKDRLKWRDLYKVNSARYERQDAEVELQILISEDAKKGYYEYYSDKDNLTSITSDYIKRDGDAPGNGYKTDGTLLTAKIKVSDAAPVAQRIVVDNSNQTKSPENTEIKAANIVNGVSLENQYGYRYSEENGHSFVYTISNYKENEVNTSVEPYNNDTRYKNNYNIIDNKSTNSRIEGVERGDTYKVTIELSNSGLTPQEVEVKAGADSNAKIESNIGILNSPEYELRYKYLGYNR